MATHFLIRHKVLSSLVGVVLLLAVFLALFDLDWLRGPVQRMASAKTERAISLGHLGLKWAWPPVLKLKQVRVANMPGGTPAQMISADEIDIAVSLPSLLGHDIVITHVSLEKPDIHLQRLADGRKNWTFGKPSEPSKGSVKVLGLSVDKGQFTYADAILNMDVAVQAATGPSKLDDSALHRSLTTQLAFKGHYAKTVFDGTASAGDILSLQETGKAFPVLTTFMLGKTRISADGSITDLLKPSAIDAQLSVAGPDMAALYPALPLALPTSPPYRFAGRFTMRDKTYAYDGFKGVIGKSDIAGDARFTSRSPRPHLAAKLRSKYTDLDDLGPLIGLGPRQRHAVVKDASGRPEVSPRADAVMKVKSSRVLPQTPFKLEKLNAMDADVTLDVGRLRVPDELPLEDLNAILKVDAGRLTLEPLKLGVAGGNIVAHVRLDGQQDPIAVDTNIDIAHAKLRELFPTVKIMKSSNGIVGAKVQLVGRGNSIANILGSAKGSAEIAMSGGSVSNLMMEAVGLDGGEIIKFLVRGDEQTPIRCAGASFKITDGVARSNLIVFDTGDTRVDGDGYLDMKNEQFEILLKPEPKDRSILALRVPVMLHGSFAKPGYSVKTGELALRSGAAVALGFVNPLLALVPLIETGPGTNTDCSAVFRAAAPAVKNGRASR